MANNPIISVIVPVYNVEMYLSQCVESIINQTYPHLEIILVDDGSTDASGQLCDRYAEKDTRIKVIHKVNGGLSSARNVGMSVMTGEYVAFVDSDDWLELDTYRAALAEFIQDPRLNVVSFTFMSINSDGTKKVSRQSSAVYVGMEASNALAGDKFHVMVWSYLYRRDIIQGMSFMEGRLSEDQPFTAELMSRPEVCVKTLSAPYYNYRRQREGSIMNVRRERCVTETILNLKDLFERGVFERNALPFLSRLFAECKNIRYGAKVGLTPEMARDRYNLISSTIKELRTQELTFAGTVLDNMLVRLNMLVLRLPYRVGFPLFLLVRGLGKSLLLLFNSSLYTRR